MKLKLRIKDSVDLKELEKYDFEYSEIPGKDYGKCYYNGSIEINIFDRILSIHLYEDDYVSDKDIETLYNLISDELIEKVD